MRELKSRIVVIAGITTIVAVCSWVAAPATAAPGLSLIGDVRTVGAAPTLTGTATCSGALLADLMGMAVPNHLIQIRDANWNIKAKVYADARGQWYASEVAGLCSNAEDNVILEEANNGQRVVLLTITAKPPTLTGAATCSGGLADLAGTANAGNLIQIRDGNWNIRAKAYADARGLWTASKVAGLCSNTKKNVLVEEADNGRQVATMILTAYSPTPTLTGTATCSGGLMTLSGTAGPGNAIQIFANGSDTRVRAYADINGNWTASDVTGRCHWAKDTIVLQEVRILDPVLVATVTFTVVNPTPPAFSGEGQCDWTNKASFHGVAGSGHLIQVRDAMWNIRARVYADTRGVWSVAGITGLCAVNAKDNVILEEANNGQRIAILTVTADNPYPLTAKVASRNAVTGAINLTGTAWPNHLIQIRDAAWNIKAQVNADRNGNWTATNVVGLVPVGKAGQIIIEDAYFGQRVAVITVNVAA